LGLSEIIALIPGSTLFAKGLFAIAIVTVIGLLCATLFAIVYHRIIYPMILAPRYDRAYTPRCSVILPCKGLPYNFENNIRSFLELDYPSYEVLYCVESESDPAVAVIKKVAADDPRARLVVAGLTSNCGQKNHNMLAAVKVANAPEVFVFADSDIKPRADWMRALVLPLSDPKIAVASGFRWLYHEERKLGGIANAYQNSILYILFTAASFFQDIGLWGGSMAMRVKDFVDLRVGECWAETVVDDMSLSEIVMKSKSKSVMVSSCITPTEDTIDSFGKSVAWYKRQVLYLKAHQKMQWYATIPGVTLFLAMYAWLPISVVYAALNGFSLSAFIAIGGLAPIALMAGTASTGLLYPLLGKHPNLLMFILCQPLSMFTVLWGAFLTLFTNRIKWSGFIYHLDFFSGKVTRVERP